MSSILEKEEVRGTKRRSWVWQYLYALPHVECPMTISYEEGTRLYSDGGVYSGLFPSHGLGLWSGAPR